ALQVGEHADDLWAEVRVDPAADPLPVDLQTDEFGTERPGVGGDADRGARAGRRDRSGGRGGDERVAAADLPGGAVDGDHERAGPRVLPRLAGRGRYQHAVLAAVEQLTDGRARHLDGEVERVVGDERGGDRLERARVGPADGGGRLRDRQQ